MKSEKVKIDKSLSKLVNFGGGRWISPDGDKLRLHLPRKEKYRPSRRTIGIFGGGRWIRTIEGIASRFTVCPLWPLGNSPICNSSVGGAGRRTRTPDLLITNQLLYQLSYTGRCSAHVRLLYYIMNPENVKRAFLQIVHCLIPFYIVLLFLVIL